MSAVQWVIDGLPDGTQKLLRAYVQDVVKAFGDHLESVLLYGSAVRGDFLPGRSNLNLVLFVSSYDVAILKQYATVHKKWSKELVVAPLFLTKDDLQASAVVFPLEYQDIHDCHRLLWGQDLLWDSTSINAIWPGKSCNRFGGISCACGNGWSRERERQRPC